MQSVTPRLAEQDIYAILGPQLAQLMVELRAARIALDQCVAVMTPEQRAEAGIALPPDATTREAARAAAIKSEGTA